MKKKAHDGAERWQVPSASLNFSRPDSAGVVHPVFHSKAWLLWLVASLTPLALTKNPCYLLLAATMSALTYHRLGRRGPTAQAWGRFLRLGLILASISVVFHVLIGGRGKTHLFSLPRLHWQVVDTTPQAVAFDFGGAVTLERLVQGLTTALALMAVLLTLATFNALADHYLLLRSLPGFFHNTATVVSIALTFVPQLIQALVEIREAQALRGYRIRRLRDLVPLFVALLGEGLERSITLAESLEARGFSCPRTSVGRSSGLVPRLVIALTLVLLLAGFAARSYFPTSSAPPAVLLGGALGLVGTLWHLGRQVRRTRYRRELWRRRDTLVATCSAVVLAVFLICRAGYRENLFFYPFPKFQWPPFEPLLAVTLLLIAVPCLAGGRWGEGRR